MVCSCAKDKNFCHMHQLELLYLKLPIYYTPPPPPTQPTCKPPCIYKSRAYNWMFIVFVHCCADTRPNTQRMYFLLVKILLHIQWLVSSVYMYCIPFFSHWCCI